MSWLAEGPALVLAGPGAVSMDVCRLVQCRQMQIDEDVTEAGKYGGQPLKQVLRAGWKARRTAL